MRVLTWCLAALAMLVAVHPASAAGSSRVKLSTSTKTVTLPRVEDIPGKMAKLGFVEAIMGYRIELALEKDFKKVLFSKDCDIDRGFKVQDIGLKPGRYWVRIARFDLLGEKQKFGPAEEHILGQALRGGKMAEAKKGLEGVVISQPGLESEVVFAAGYKVKGRVLEGFGILVDGQRAKPDKKGYFSMDIRLKPGDNNIQFTVLDPDGNVIYLLRKIVFQR